MFWTLIRKEILEHLMTLRFAIACVLCLLVVISAVLTRYQDYVQVSSDYDEDTVLEKHRIDRLDWPGDILYTGSVVRQKPNPLKIFVRGIDDVNGLSIRITGTESPQMASSELSNPLVPLFPAMDLTYFVGVILSLLAIIFGYDAVCGEHERGTLRLMLSYSVPRDQILLGKWIGGYVVLVIPFLLAVICGAAIILIQHRVNLTGAEWLKVVALWSLALLYVAAIYSLALWVSTITARPATSVIILVTLWVILVLAIPNVSPYLAESWRPTPNAERVDKARDDIVDQVYKDMKTKVDAYDKEHGFREKWWENFNWSDPEQRKRVTLRWKYETELERDTGLSALRGMEKIDQSFEAALQSQVAVNRWISRISPFSCYAMAAAEIAGTGELAKRHLIQQLRRYQVVLSEYVYDEVLRMCQYELDNNGKSLDWRKNRGKAFPVFVETPPPGAQYARAVALDAGLLASMVVLFFMLSFLAFIRYDAR